jgi:heat shock protein HslJ
MPTKKILLTTLFVSLLSTNTFADLLTKDSLNSIKGNWHLRVLDGHDVKKARAIIDFHSRKMFIDGFDSCNRFSGYLKVKAQNTFYSKLKSSRMACRQNIHQYTSQRMKTTIEEGFTITEESRYGIDGITLKSKSHNLFFKKMGGTGSILDIIK